MNYEREEETLLKLIFLLWGTALFFLGVPGLLVYAVFPGTRDWLSLAGPLMMLVLVIPATIGDIAKTVLVWLSPDLYGLYKKKRYRGGG